MYFLQTCIYICHVYCDYALNISENADNYSSSIWLLFSYEGN